MEEQSPLTEPQAPPSVSILIALRPGSPPIEPLLHSFEQSPSQGQNDIAVLDNGAGLVTGAVEERFPDVSFRKLPRFFGYTKAINILARHAAGEYLLFWDPALQPAPGTISGLLNALEAHPEAGAVAPLILNSQGSPDMPAYALPDAAALAAAWPSARMAVRAAPAASEPFAVDCLDIPAILVRRDFVRGMNYFDDRYGEFGPLLELCYQLRQSGKKLLVITDCPATRLPASPASGAAEAQRAADFALGAARYLARRHGFGAGLSFRMKAALGSLGRALTFQSPGRNARQFWLITSGQKIDGTQGAA